MHKSCFFSAIFASLLAFAPLAEASSHKSVDTLMKSIDQVGTVYTPEKTTHTELLLRIRALGCHYRMNNRHVTDPDDIMKNTFGWFYRAESHGISNCFPSTVFFQNKNDTDVIEIDAGAEINLAALLSAMKLRWGEPIVTKGRRQNANHWVFNAGDRTIVLKETGILSNFEIEIRPTSYYQEVNERILRAKAREEAALAERERRKLMEEEGRSAALKHQRQKHERLAKAQEEAKTHRGRVFGILTPGVTNFDIAEIKAQELGCRILGNGQVVREDKYGRKVPCFDLPGRPTLFVEHFKGGLGFVVRYDRDGDVVDAMRNKLSRDLGSVSAYENRGIVNHFWNDDTMTVVETGHHKPGVPINYYFISRETFNNELARILQEKEEAADIRRQELETLEKMF